MVGGLVGQNPPGDSNSSYVEVKVEWTRYFFGFYIGELVFD